MSLTTTRENQGYNPVDAVIESIGFFSIVVDGTVDPQTCNSTKTVLQHLDRTGQSGAARIILFSGGFHGYGFEYTYNTMNGLINTKLPSGVTLRYEYDDAQRLKKVDTAYGKTNYEYDKLNRLVRVVDHNGAATVYEYDENGNRSAVRYANGMIDRYEYDTLNRLISLKTLDRDENTIVKYLYTLGDAGERLKVEEQDREVLYEYDALYRLTKETIIKEDKTTEISYTYDSVGNRLKKVHDGIITEYTYNGLNQLLTENDIEYSYDLNGNLISKTGPDEEVIYTYDFENRLIKAVIKKEGSITTEEYQYDWAGNRVSKISDGIEIKYVVDTNGWLSQVIAELDGDGNLKTFYTRGEDLISLCKEDEIRYYLYDGNGSVRMLADEAGIISDTYTYECAKQSLAVSVGENLTQEKASHHPVTVDLRPYW